MRGKWARGQSRVTSCATCGPSSSRCCRGWCLVGERVTAPKVWLGDHGPGRRKTATSQPSSEGSWPKQEGAAHCPVTLPSPPSPAPGAAGLFALPSSPAAAQPPSAGPLLPSRGLSTESPTCTSAMASRGARAGRTQALRHCPVHGQHPPWPQQPPGVLGKPRCRPGTPLPLPPQEVTQDSPCTSSWGPGSAAPRCRQGHEKKTGCAGAAHRPCGPCVQSQGPGP